MVHLSMAINVRITPSSELSLRDPQETDLGRRILTAGIELLNDLGLEDFTFKKLARHIGSVEASIYRYFANKHQLLLYLVSWYWDWVHYLVNQAILGEQHPDARLRATITALTRPFIENPGTPYIDERLLHKLVINEGSKAYRTKAVDEENSRGVFTSYKTLTEDISQLLLELNPNFPYPRSLATSLFEMAHNHPYYAEHLPRLTDLSFDDDRSAQLETMLWYWVTHLLDYEPAPSTAG